MRRRVQICSKSRIDEAVELGALLRNPDLSAMLIFQ